MLVVGTRPEALKLAPLAESLRAAGHRLTLALTGQHPALDPAAYRFGPTRLLRLRCPAVPDPRAHGDHVAAALQPALRGSDRPDLVIVQGDTSSALGGALGAAAAGVPIAHVEAGLRSHDLSLPWPEEPNRVAIDALADLLFAPTPGNAENLVAEGVPGIIRVTGNTAIDALLDCLGHLPEPQPRPARRLLVTCHRRENWGAAFAPIGLALLDLARLPGWRIDFVLHGNPAMANAARLMLGGASAITLLPPLSHAEMIATLRSASLVLSDSGGIQEEAPALGIPLLVLRATTERPEGIASGNSRLVGNDREAIVRTVRELADDPAALAAMARPALPFGDGRAAERIAAHVTAFLVERHRRPARLIA